jgi:hypothetical protein
MRALGWLLIVAGMAASALCSSGLLGDEAYYKALKGIEKYPNNVLYITDLKMAEPRHMLLLAGSFGSALAGLVFGSMCLALARLLNAPARDRP